MQTYYGLHIGGAIRPNSRSHKALRQNRHGTSVGIYTITGYMVASCTPEIGARMVLAGTRKEIMLLVFRQGSVSTLVGLGCGLAAGVVLVDFYATWCPPCAVQAPILEEVADRLQGRAQVAKLDIDKARSIAQRYGVTAIPTLILLRDGVEIKRFVGVTSADVLVTAILAAVDSASE